MHVSLAALAIYTSILGLSSAQSDASNRSLSSKTTTKTSPLTTVSTIRSTKTTSSATRTTTTPAPTCPGTTCNKIAITTCSRTFNLFRSDCGVLPDGGDAIENTVTYLNGTLSECNAVAACAKSTARDGEPDFYVWLDDDGEDARSWICSEGYIADGAEFSSAPFVKQVYAYKGVLTSSCN